LGKVDGGAGPGKAGGGDAALKKIFAKFTEWNGPAFGYDDFLHVTEMNNLADELANKGIMSLRDV
jgi:hypothetical protein